jgi:hypothetical protein
MGWSGGSGIAADLIRAAKKHVPESSRPAFYKVLVRVLEDEDCDTLDECRGMDPAFDRVMNKVYKERYGTSWEEDHES